MAHFQNSAPYPQNPSHVKTEPRSRIAWVRRRRSGGSWVRAFRSIRSSSDAIFAWKIIKTWFLGFQKWKIEAKSWDLRVTLEWVCREVEVWVSEGLRICPWEWELRTILYQSQVWGFRVLGIKDCIFVSVVWFSRHREINALFGAWLLVLCLRALGFILFFSALAHYIYDSGFLV